MRDCAHAGRHLHAPVTRGRVMSIPALQRPLGATRIQEKPMAAPQPAHLRQQPRSRRWLIWLVAIAVLLGAYAVALRWVTLKVESGVEASVHPLRSEQHTSELQSLMRISYA